MKSMEGKPGRVFLLRLEKDDPLPKCIEDFAVVKKIRFAQVIFIGGIYRGDIVTGPRSTSDPKPDPIVLPVTDAHEAMSAGVIAPDEKGRPVLHMHGALGRSGQTTTGCFQRGLSVWLVGEAVIHEILSEANARRMMDEAAELNLLEIRE
jgi:uncharacterized protein